MDHECRVALRSGGAASPLPCLSLFRSAGRSLSQRTPSRVTWRSVCGTRGQSAAVIIHESDTKQSRKRRPSDRIRAAAHHRSGGRSAGPAHLLAGAEAQAQPAWGNDTGGRGFVAQDPAHADRMRLGRAPGHARICSAPRRRRGPAVEATHVFRRILKCRRASFVLLALCLSRLLRPAAPGPPWSDAPLPGGITPCVIALRKGGGARGQPRREQLAAGNKNPDGRHRQP